MTRKERNEKRLEAMKKKLEELSNELLNSGIDPNAEMDESGIDPNAEIDEEPILSQLFAEGMVNNFYENHPELDISQYVPEQTAGLSFHDLDCQEYSLIILPTDSKEYCFNSTKSLEIFVHTFLEDYPEADYYRS
jgi:hypothetical protein